MIRAKDILESLMQMNERNVLNTDEIEDWIEQLVGQTENSRVQEWIRKRLRMYLINDQSADTVDSLPDDAPEWAEKAFERGEDLYHVSFDDDEWNDIIDLLHRMDRLAEFSPRDFDKMMKTPMSPDLLERAAELEKRMDKRQGVEETGIHYSDGCRWVLLKTFDTIKWEGEEMGNCLKQNTYKYYKEVEEGTTVLYSLRDRSDNPRASLDVDGNGEIRQIRGFQNGAVDEPYQEHVFDLIDKKSLVCDQRSEVSNIGGVIVNSRVYKKDNAPVIDMRLHFADGSRWVILPTGDGYDNDDLYRLIDRDGTVIFTVTREYGGNYGEVLCLADKQGQSLSAYKEVNVPRKYQDHFKALSNSLNMILSATLEANLELYWYFGKTYDEKEYPWDNAWQKAFLGGYFDEYEDTPPVPPIETMVRHVYIDMPINSEGETALMLSCYFDLDSTTITLLKLGANPNVQDNLGRTALMRAGTRRLVKILCKYKARLDIQDKEGETALSAAVSRRDYEVIDELLDLGADPDGAGTPLRSMKIDDKTKKIFKAHKIDIESSKYQYAESRK
jgi:hypothetical protein